MGLTAQIMYLARTLDVDAHLQAYRETLLRSEHDVKGAQYYLLELDAKAWTANLTGFKNLQEGLARYADVEKRNIDKSGQDAVLVSADNLEELKRVFPNYLADTHVFLGTLMEAVSGPNR